MFSLPYSLSRGISDRVLKAALHKNVSKDASLTIFLSHGLVFFSTLAGGLLSFLPGLSEQCCSSLVGLPCLLLLQFTRFASPRLGTFASFLPLFCLPLLLRKIGDPPPSSLISACAHNFHRMSPGDLGGICCNIEAN